MYYTVYTTLYSNLQCIDKKEDNGTLTTVYYPLMTEVYISYSSEEKSDKEIQLVYKHLHNQS